MSWIFVIEAGAVLSPSRAQRLVAYAGNGDFKNNPDADFLIDHGPLPVGGYTLLTPLDGTRLGPCAIPLDPDPTNAMGGRGDFYWHDDSISHPGEASDGCLVTVGVAGRRAAWASGDHRLEVVATDADVPAPAA